MADLFPRTWYPRLGLNRQQIAGNVLKSNITSGRILRVSRWPSGYERWRFTFDKLGQDTLLDDIFTFHHDQGGSLTAFDLADYLTWVWDYKISFGTGTAALTYDLPGDEITAETIYVNSIAQSDPADYSISAGTGTNGRDQVVFTGSVNGQALEIKFAGKRFFTAHFEDDTLTHVPDRDSGGTVSKFTIIAENDN